jgi:hypothetical protein
MSVREQPAESIFEIDITIQNNTLIAGVNGGNILGKPGDRILFRADPDGPRFTLEFFQVASEPALHASKPDPCEEIEVAKLPRWPFAEPPEPKGGVIGPTHEFIGVLARYEANEGETRNEDETKKYVTKAFKYYVTVRNLRLDPIIIIDRK